MERFDPYSADNSASIAEPMKVRRLHPYSQAALRPDGHWNEVEIIGYADLTDYFVFRSGENYIVISQKDLKDVLKDVLERR